MTLLYSNDCDVSRRSRYAKCSSRLAALQCFITPCWLSASCVGPLSNPCVVDHRLTNSINNTTYILSVSVLLYSIWSVAVLLLLFRCNLYFPHTLCRECSYENLRKIVTTILRKYSFWEYSCLWAKKVAKMVYLYYCISILALSLLSYQNPAKILLLWLHSCFHQTCI